MALRRMCFIRLQTISNVHSVIGNTVAGCTSCYSKISGWLGLTGDFPPTDPGPVEHSTRRELLSAESRNSESELCEQGKKKFGSYCAPKFFGSSIRAQKPNFDSNHQRTVVSIENFRYQILKSSVFKIHRDSISLTEICFLCASISIWNCEISSQYAVPSFAKSSKKIDLEMWGRQK